MAQPFLDNLYCTEEHCDDVEVEQQSYENPNHGIILLQQQKLLPEEDNELASLLSKERRQQPIEKLQASSSLSDARREAVEWILLVNFHYSFSTLTALLAIDFLDRFLSTAVQIQVEKPWMTQLAAVACISLAAKVEETHVPLLLDLQVEQSSYIFEAKTIKRMEILVLSTLQWRMHPVTPFSFLDYIIRRLGFKDPLLSYEFLRRCERTILSLIIDCRFTSFLPSVVACATMLHVVNSIEPCLVAPYQNQFLGILGIDKDKVDNCCRFILEAIRGRGNRRRYGTIPGSPNGVVDMSFSSDSSNDCWAASPPLSKKSRVDNV